MELTQVMRTTFAAREFTEEELDDATLYRILDNARFAPSGGNRQGWRVIVVRDQQKRAALVDLMRPAVQRYLAEMMAGESPLNTVVPSKVDGATIAAVEVPAPMLERIAYAPVLLLVAVDLHLVASFDADLPRVGVISGASIYPFAWNILLAARDEGLGGTLTTFVTAAEAQVKRLFDLPETFAVSALIPLGRPVRQLTKLRRNAVETFTTVDAYDGPALAKATSRD